MVVIDSDSIRSDLTVFEQKNNFNSNKLLSLKKISIIY